MNPTARDRRHALVFVLASALLLVAVLATLKGVRLARHERAYVVLVPDSVAGLRAGSAVEYKGVPAGVVREIGFREGSVETVAVELAIREGVPVKRDTRARLRPQGITGLNVLELAGGTARAEELGEGGEIPFEPGVLAELESTVHDVARLARRLEATTAAIESETSEVSLELRRTLVAGRESAAVLGATAASIGTEAATTAAALREGLEPLRAIARDPAWRELGPEVLDAVRDVRRASQRLEGAAGAAEGLARENEGDVRALVQDLRAASAELRALARRVGQDPASVLVEHPPREKEIPEPLPPREARP